MVSSEVMTYRTLEAPLFTAVTVCTAIANVSGYSGSRDKRIGSQSVQTKMKRPEHCLINTSTYLNSSGNAVRHVDFVPSTDLLGRHKLSIRAIAKAACLRVHGNHVSRGKLHHVVSNKDLHSGRSLLVVMHKDDLGGRRRSLW